MSEKLGSPNSKTKNALMETARTLRILGQCGSVSRLSAAHTELPSAAAPKCVVVNDSDPNTAVRVVPLLPQLVFDLLSWMKNLASSAAPSSFRRTVVGSNLSRFDTLHLESCIEPSALAETKVQRCFFERSISFGGHYSGAILTKTASYKTVFPVVKSPIKRCSLLG